MINKKTDTNLPIYQKLAEALRKLDALSEAAELHALLCALCTGGAHVKINAWIDSLLPSSLESENAKIQSAVEVLSQMYQATKWHFSNHGVDFQLLLPSNSAPFYQRITALAMWCQGYLAGLGLSKINLSQSANEVKEAVNDLVDISRLQYDGEIDGKEDQEKSYTELVEYTKIAVLRIDNKFNLRKIT